MPRSGLWAVGCGLWQATAATLSICSAIPALASTGVAAAGDLEVPAAVEAAVRDALRVTGGRVEIARAKGPKGSCEPLRAEVQRAIRGSGRVPVKLVGKGCTGWAWLEVRVFAQVALTTRAIGAGEKLEGAVRFTEREVLEGRAPLTTLPEGATALRAVPDNTVIDQTALRAPGPQPGEAVTVVLRSGFLELSEPGRAVPCTPGRACAVLPGGKRVEGVYAEGKLMVAQ